MSVWDKYDEVVDNNAIKESIEKAKNNEPEEVPAGETYRMKITKMECGFTKNNDPKVVVEFQITQGEYKNYRLWWHQTIVKGFSIHVMNEFLKSLDTGLDIEWKSYGQYGDLIAEIFAEVKDKLMFDIKYTKKGDFPSYEVVEIYDM